jgi:hypothetical protein
MIEALRSSGTSVITRTTRRHIPEYGIHRLYMSWKHSQQVNGGPSTFPDEYPFMQRRPIDLSQAAILLLYMWEVFGSNRDAIILTEAWVALLNYSHPTPRRVP